MKSLSQYITEAQYPIEFPLDGILDKTGRHLAQLPMFTFTENNWDTFPRYKFVFKNASDKKNFKNSIGSDNFFKEIYDYKFGGSNDYTHVDELMHSFGNIIVNKDKALYICLLNPSKEDEFHERCTKAGKTYDFKKVEFIK